MYVTKLVIHGKWYKDITNIDVIIHNQKLIMFIGIVEVGFMCSCLHSRGKRLDISIKDIDKPPMGMGLYQTIFAFFTQLLTCHAKSYNLIQASAIAHSISTC